MQMKWQDYKEMGRLGEVVQKFNVGTKVWFIDSEKPVVKMLMVSEEIIKKTLAGDTTEYVFQIPVRGDMKNFHGSSLSGTFFKKRQEVFDFMHNQAADAINNMLNSAEEPFSENNKNENPLLEETSDDIIVELPDGKKARIKGGLK